MSDERYIHVLTSTAKATDLLGDYLDSLEPNKTHNAAALMNAKASKDAAMLSIYGVPHCIAQSILAHLDEKEGNMKKAYTSTLGLAVVEKYITWLFEPIRVIVSDIAAAPAARSTI